MANVYVLKRILWFIPTLFAVTAIGFILLANAPGDPVNTLSNSAKASGNIESQKTFWRKKLGLDLPLFYFSITTLSEPDTLYKVYDEEKLKTFKALLQQSGNADAIHNFQRALNSLAKKYEFEKKKFNSDQDKERVWKLQTHINGLSTFLNNINHESNLDSIKKIMSTFDNYKANLWIDLSVQKENLFNAIDILDSEKTTYKNL